MTPILIPIKQDKPGFERFIGSWICPGDPSIVVDVGPSRSMNLLLQSLSELGMARIDFILLTHIHVDHAGGLAEFLDAFPSAQVICHAKAIKHLLDPTALWESSQSSLGELAALFGRMKAVRRERIIPHPQGMMENLKIIETPGHAPHHLCFSYLDHLFVGEASGVYIIKNGSEYLRPTTPPKFFFDEYLRSLDRLLSIGDQPICFAHFGKATSSRQLLNRCRKQLILWQRLVKEEMDFGKDRLLERCVKRVFEEDPELSAVESMDSGEKEREKYFVANSVKGFLGHLGGILE